MILLTEMEHHSNLVPWQLLAERIGARLRFVPVRDDGTLALEQLEQLLTSEVKLFAFTHVSNSLGTINPVAELCRKARAVGALTLVDAAQSAGHLPIDVQELGCDFLAFSGHKMCGPTGIGVLYGRAEILDAMPPWHGGGEMIVSVTLEKSSFKKAPHRFEAGTPNIAGAIGLAAAIDYIEEIGRTAIFEHDAQLTSYAIQRFAELPGVRILGPSGERGAIVGFVMETAHPHDLTTFADQHGLALRGGHHCNQPLMRRFGLPGHDARQFLFLQHDGRDRSHDRHPRRRRAVLRMSLDLEELYQEVILDHSRRPRNFGVLENADVLVHGDNPACGDEIHLGVQFGTDGRLEEIKFSGQGCAISLASASMMTTKLKGKSRAEATEMGRAFQNLVTAGESEQAKSLGDLQLLQGVRKFPQRVKCAMLAWRAVEQALAQSAGEATVSTEADAGNR